MRTPTARAARTAAAWAEGMLGVFKTGLLNLVSPLGAFQLVGELVEVEVALARFEFAALKVYVIGPHGALVWGQFLTVVAVGGEPVVIEAAEVKVAQFAF